MIEDEKIVELVWMLLGSAILGLVGFVWKISHRVSELSSRVDSMQRVQERDLNEVRKDIDMICSNVDKHREWSTNRMMSMVRDSKG